MVYVCGVHWHGADVYSGVYGSVSGVCGVISPRVVPTRVITSINISCVDFLLGVDVVTNMMLLCSSGCRLNTLYSSSTVSDILCAISWAMKRRVSGIVVSARSILSAMRSVRSK